MRFFRTASAELYESIRLQLDAAWGHPDEQTETCIDPAAVAPRDQQGRIMLAVDADFCQYDEVAAILPELLASGAVEEIDAATYQASLPTLPNA